MANARMFFSRLRTEAEVDRQRQLIDLLLRDFEEHASDWLWEISHTGIFATCPRAWRSLLACRPTMLPAESTEAATAFEQLQSHLRLG